MKLGKTHQRILDSADKDGRVTCRVNYRQATQALKTLRALGLVELKIVDTKSGPYGVFVVGRQD